MDRRRRFHTPSLRPADGNGHRRKTVGNARDNRAYSSGRATRQRATQSTHMRMRRLRVHHWHRLPTSDRPNAPTVHLLSDGRVRFVSVQRARLAFADQMPPTHDALVAPCATGVQNAFAKVVRWPFTDRPRTPSLF